MRQLVSVAGHARALLHRSIMAGGEMKLKRIAFLLLTISFMAKCAHAAGTVNVLNVNVECSCDDLIGNRVCHGVKEKIRASHGFHFVFASQMGGFTMNFVCLDTGSERAGDLNNESAMAYALTFQSSDKLPIFVVERLYLVGSNKIDAIADDIVSDLDKDSDFTQHPSN